MSIFLSYGFSLGSSAAASAWSAGCLFVLYINEIAKLIEMVTGQEVFDPTIYYFQQIPTIVDPVTIVWRDDRRRADRRAGQRAARPARRPAASGGGLAL